MNKVGAQLHRISLWTVLCAALVLALPAAAGAQFMDPVLDQYAPSSQQIDKKVKGDGGDADSGGADGGDTQTDSGTAAGGPGQGDGSDAGGGGGSAGGSAGDGGAGGNGDGSTGGSSGVGGNAGSSSASEGAGLDARLLTDVPLTRFDFLAFAIGIGVLIGTGLLLRRLSRSPHVEA